MNLDKQIILSLGTNLGEREKNLTSALDALRESIRITTVSNLYSTLSLLRDNQDNYLNICCLGHTSLNELELLNFIKSVENKLGRIKTGRWQSRLIDIDIIDYDNKVFKSEFLTIPHIEMENRSFVLYPLRDVLPSYRNPVSGKTIDRLIENIEDTLDLKKVGELKWQ
jgi:2-amino-4-hydroxy-6-hydroxymethyldihydropteridine diphosphokinase